MANYPGLTQRGGIWHVRKRIPTDLEHIDPRGSIRISLGTKDKREAVREYHLRRRVPERSACMVAVLTEKLAYRLRR